MTNRTCRGRSVHIGLNRVDPHHYAGWSGELAGCELDAEDLAALASEQGFEARTILSAEATSDTVVAAIAAAGAGLVEGDVLLVTYSGHGSQLPDTSHDGSDDEPHGAPDHEPDGLDETWALFDRQLIDDELAARWAALAAGVRVLVLSDSCHSGSVVRELAATVEVPGPFDLFGDPSSGPRRAAIRALPRGVARSTYDANRATYAAVRLAAPPAEASAVGAHVLLLSGCQDDQESLDGDRNGLFTETLLAVWDAGRFRGGHRGFWREIVARMPPWQQPNWFVVGRVNAAFHRTRPFTLR